MTGLSNSLSDPTSTYDVLIGALAERLEAMTTQALMVASMTRNMEIESQHDLWLAVSALLP